MQPHLPAVEGGFVRMPRSYIALPVSPGAKVLLMHLCSAANDDGESWWSYDDIAELIGRSKAAVSGYVQELVKIGVIAAVQQRMANGYNYRRLLRVLQWRDLLSYWAQLGRKGKSGKNKSVKAATEHKSEECSASSVSARQTTKTVPEAPASVSPAQAKAHVPHPAKEKTLANLPSEKTERSIQPGERKNPTGSNKNPKTKTLAALAAVGWDDACEEQWKAFRPVDSDPLGVFQEKPSEDLLHKLADVTELLEQASKELNPAGSLNQARTSLRGFAIRHKLAFSEDDLESCASELSTLATSSAQTLALAALDEIWKPHWKKLPTCVQMRRHIEQNPSRFGDQADVRLNLGKFRGRLWHAKMALGVSTSSRGMHN